MPILLSWADSSQTIVLCEMEGDWTWEEFHTITAQAQHMIGSVSHVVNVVVHMLNSGKVPGKVPFPEIEANFLASPPNTGVLIVISRKKIVQRAFALTSKFYAIDGLFFLVPTEEEANLVLQARSGRQQLKSSLIDQMRSQDIYVVYDAIEKLRSYEWLYDGTLEGANLSNAILEEVNLFLANMRGVDLSRANLRLSNLFRVDMEGANLAGADLRAASLSEASLIKVNLAGADLARAQIVSCDLRGADLSGANLRDAVLTGAWLIGTRFDENTILPDKTNWRPLVDLAKFTEANPEDAPSENA